MAKDYIPRPNVDFNLFQKRLAQQVNTNAAAWNIPAGEVNTLVTASAEYSNLYQLIANKGNRTLAQVQAHKEFRKTYEQDLRLFVNSFLRSNALVSKSVLTGMGIKTREKKRRHRTLIDTSPDVLVHSSPGTWLKFWCRVESKIGKACIHPESDGVEMWFSIGTRPTSWKDCSYTHFSKKAHFKINIKEEWRGKIFYGFLRWRNLINDELSGPYCEVVMEMVY